MTLWSGPWPALQLGTAYVGLFAKPPVMAHLAVHVAEVRLACNNLRPQLSEGSWRPSSLMWTFVYSRGFWPLSLGFGPFHFIICWPLALPGH
jgi:hypothetical protein